MFAACLLLYYNVLAVICAVGKEKNQIKTPLVVQTVFAWPQIRTVLN